MSTERALRPGTARPGHQPLSWRGFRLGTAAAAVIVMAGCLAIFGPWIVADARVVTIDSLNLVAQVVGLTWCWHRYRSAPDGSGRLVWLLLSVNGALWTVGNCFFLYYTASVASPPSPSLADAFYIAGVAPALVALGAFPVRDRVRGAGWRFVLDALVLGNAVALLCYLVLLKDVFATAGGGVDALVLSTYPVTDVLLVTLVGVLLLRGMGRRLDLVLLAAGFLAFAIADASYAYLASRGVYSSGGVLDLGYLLGPLLIGLGALAPQVASTTRPGLSQGRAFAAVLPDLVVLAAVAAFALHGRPDLVAWLLGGLTVILTAVRQVVISTDNHFLRAHLEQRVHERTEELTRLSLNHEQILESVGEGIYGVDTTGRISFVNPTAARLLGREAHELVGKEVRATLQAADQSGAESLLNSVMMTGETQTRSDLEYIRRDGSIFPVEVTAAASRADGSAGAVVIFRDISERRAMDRMKSEFIAVVSHELRTPLTSVSAGLEMLADGDLGELPNPAQNVVGVALRGTDRLARLIDDILDIERLESGAVALAFTAQPAEPLVTSALHSIMPIADAAGVSLIVGDVDGWVHADGDRVIQVLINLLGNAVKFTEAGCRLWVSAGVDGEEVTFMVVDEGRGIPESQLENIFEPFRQVTAHDAREMGGTGLGLAIARSIVQRHGGRLWVESEVGVGSTFRFTVPAASRSREPEPSQA